VGREIQWEGRFRGEGFKGRTKDGSRKKGGGKGEGKGRAER